MSDGGFDDVGVDRAAFDWPDPVDPWHEAIAESVPVNATEAFDAPLEVEAEGAVNGDVDSDAVEPAANAADLNADAEDPEVEVAAELLHALSWDSGTHPAAGAAASVFEWLPALVPPGWTAIAREPASSVWAGASTDPVVGFVDVSYLHPKDPR